MTTFWISLFTTLIVVAGLLVLPILVSLTRKQIAVRKSPGAPDAPGAPVAQPVAGTTQPVAPVTEPVVVEAPVPTPKPPGYLSKVRGEINPFTLFGILVFTAILIIFMLVPGDIVAYIGQIVMGILVVMILVSGVMLLSRKGSRLVWIPLLVGFFLLAFNSPQTTAQKVAETTATITKEVAETTATITKEGLKGVTTDLVPNFTATPAEREAARKADAERLAANRKAEAERLAAEDKARREEELHQAEVRGTETAAYEAEVEKTKPLTAAAFTTRTAGTFEPILIKSGTRIGPIYLYKACGLRWTKSGIGMIKILTRADEKDAPVEAELNNDDYSIKKVGHADEPEDVFFEAVQGDIQIEMIRFDNGTNKENPCN